MKGVGLKESTSLMLIRYLLGIQVLGVCLLLPDMAATAQDGQWNIHTSMRQANDVAIGADRVWTATTGGLFSYDTVTGEIRRYSTIDGLHGIDPTTVSFDDHRQVLWLGYRDGVIDRLEIEDGTVQTVRDISRATQFSSRSINNLRMHGDTLFVATGFGLVAFDPENNEVRASYNRFGEYPSAIPVNDVVVGADTDNEIRIWVGTEEGVAHAPLAGTNLQEPGQWTNEIEGLPSVRVLSLAAFDGNLYAGTESDLAIRSGDGTWVPRDITENLVSDLRATSDFLYGVERFRLIMVDRSGNHQLIGIHGFGNPIAIDLDQDAGVWLGDSQNGLVGLGDTSHMPLTIAPEYSTLPDGPDDHFFLDFDFDPEDNLWAAGALTATSGFYRLKDGEWTSYSQRLNPELTGGSFSRVHASPNGDVWSGSHGAGLVRLTSDGTLQTFNHINSPLERAPGTDSYVAIRGIDTDREGRVWVTNEFAAPHLNFWSADEGWQTVPDPQAPGIPSSGLYDRLLIDSNDFKWATLRAGLVVLDTGNDPTDAAEHRVRYFGSRGSGGRGLPDTAVRSVVEDRQGRIWIGTARGIAFFFAPSLVFSNDPNANEPQWPVQDGAFFLRDLSVNYLAVDPANRIWIASNDGAWLIEGTGDGHRIVQHFTTNNSPLLSNNVMAVAVQESTGIVYFATDQGAMSWRGDATAPVASAGDLIVYPNPVRVQANGSTPSITIEGLVESTDLRILTPAGSVVASMATRGGRVVWDGTDISGNPVPSGMYLVVAVGRDGEGVSTGKIAIIR